MKYKLTEQEKELMQEVKDITITKYEIDNEGYITIEDLMCAIEDLVIDAKNQEEKYQDLKNRMESYYELKSEWRSEY